PQVVMHDARARYVDVVGAQRVAHDQTDLFRIDAGALDRVASGSGVHIGGETVRGHRATLFASLKGIRSQVLELLVHHALALGIRPERRLFAALDALRQLLAPAPFERGVVGVRSYLRWDVDSNPQNSHI